MKRWIWEKDRKKAIVYDIILMTRRTNIKPPEETYLMQKSMKELEELHFKLCRYVSTIAICQKFDTRDGNLEH